MSPNLIYENRFTRSRRKLRSTLENIWTLLSSLVVAMGTRSRRAIAIGSWWIIGIVIALIIVGGIVVAVIVLTPGGTTTTLPYP